MELYENTYILGRHCCLWCEVEGKNLKLPLRAHGSGPLTTGDRDTRLPSPCRSLATLERDHMNFITIGKGDIKKAKEYKNVIGSRFFDIPLVQVLIL